MNPFINDIEDLAEGHPVRVYFEESLLIKNILYEIASTDLYSDFEGFVNLFNQLSGVEKRFARKENQLFPYLEKHGWNGPSQGMWAFHDELRSEMKLIRKYADEKNLKEIEHNLNHFISEMQRLMHIEEIRLFPNAMSLLTEDDWKEMREGDEEIGWMLNNPPAPYPPKEERTGYGQNIPKKEFSFSLEDKIHYDEGYMTPQQVNLLLKFMPVDLTFVDENDKVIFYNRGNERVFPRSAGIIGREVKFCHPPKSVDTVLKILEEFKKGTKDAAEFWIKYKQRVIHIRYFAIRDEDKNYKGVIEMSQDITDIQKLEGEQRLLDWE
ncbi:MAG: PAS domain-containing protein [Spirochaetia bacterium]|nr:PAS domain-containing protein [Spirochaetia bacterium]